MVSAVGSFICLATMYALTGLWIQPALPCWSDWLLLASSHESTSGSMQSRNIFLYHSTICEQTAQMVEWYKKMFRDCMEPEVLSWDDASNNQSLQQGKAGWIHNPVSAYIVARNSKLPSADGINHHKSLAGPDGQRHETDVPRHIGIWRFSKNVEPSKEWIRYLLGKREVYDEYIMSGDAFNLPAYVNIQDHPVLKTDPKFAALKQEGVQFHCYGWPAPPS